MQNENRDLLNEVADYYSSKLAEHGVTPRGVDWNGEDGQLLRFEQLFKLVDGNGAFSLNDLGCGYGAFCNFLESKACEFEYCGIDVSASMIDAARDLLNKRAGVRFLVADQPDQNADYGFASGIFNVKMGRSNGEWADYIETTLDMLDRTSRRGFAFNCLTSYSDAHKMHDYLYYPDPMVIFDLCKRRYSRNVALLHDYELYEFTVLVRKAP